MHSKFFQSLYYAMSFYLPLSVYFLHKSNPEFVHVVEVLVLFVALFFDFFG